MGKNNGIFKIPKIDEGIAKTSIEAEVDWLKQVIDHRVTGFEGCASKDNRPVAEKIIRSILAHCDSTIDDETKEELIKKINQSVDKSKAVPISITIAYAVRAPNPLKNTDPYGPPTFAWLYNIAKLKLISQKVKMIYPPGIKFYVFEEGFIFRELFNIPEWVAWRNARITQNFIERLDAEEVVKILNLHPKDLPLEEIARTESSAADVEIFAMLCSMTEMRNPEIMELLYKKRDRDYEAIAKKAGNLWGKAKNITLQKNKFFTFRKETGLFLKLISKEINENEESLSERLVDGAVTEKHGRVSFKFTGETLFNHGAAVVTRDEDGKAKCVIIPEYRLIEGNFEVEVHGKIIKVRPVNISLPEFGCDSYVWLYEKI